MPRRVTLALATCVALWPACGPGTRSGSPHTPTVVGPPSSMLAPNASLTASLSGIWVGNRPANGMVVTLSGCGACTETLWFNAADLVMTVSDSSHALSGNATLTVRDGGVSGEVVPVSVTGSVGPGGHVTMQWSASTKNGGQAPTPALFALEGSVSANRMSGTLTLTGGGISAGSAVGTWSVNLQ